MNMERAR